MRVLFIIFWLFVVNITTAQQLTQIPGISGKLNYTELSEAYNVALIGGANNYVSFNQGVTWTTFNNGTGSALQGTEGMDGAIINSTTFCLIVYKASNGTYSIARTTDAGANWTLINTQYSYIQQFKAISANGNTVIVAAKNGVYRSTDAGLTWNFITLSTTDVYSKFVEYNAASASWFVGAYSSNVLVSTDDGVTWNGVNYNNINSIDIVGSSFQSNKLLLTELVSTGNKLLTIDGSNTQVDTMEIAQGLVTGGNPLRDACYLPNGKILASNGLYFFELDTATNYVYQLGNPGFTSSGTVDIELGATYGIATQNSIPTTFSKAYLVNYSLPLPPLYLSADFTILNQANTCAGDNIFAYPYADYADSVKWYVNGNYVTNNLMLNYPTPAGVFTSYVLQLKVYYMGNMNVLSHTINFSAPQPPFPYTFAVDTTACHHLPLQVTIDPASGTPNNTFVSLMYNGILMDGPDLMTSTTFNLYTDSITSSDTLLIISFNAGACDNTSDTTSIPITIGPDLLDFTLLPFDTLICIGTNPVLSLTNTHPAYSYHFNTTYSTIMMYPSNLTATGVGPDTLNMTIPSMDFANYNHNTLPDTYGPMYTNISIQVYDTAGCIRTQTIEPITVLRPTAYFDQHSYSYLQNDTMHVSNAFVTENRIWSSPQLNPQFIANTTDVVPLIVADTTGFFGIQLRNEPIPQCVDSVMSYIHYANPAPPMNPICETLKPHDRFPIQEVKYDPFGNLYEIRTKPWVNGNVPFYILEKRDPNGTLLWEKHATYQNWVYMDITGIAIETIDFDCEGNPYIAMWIQGEHDYNDDLFNFTPNFNPISECFVAKLDKNTGNIIWRVKLNDLPLPNYFLKWRITDLVVDDNFVHISTYSSYNLNMITLNTEDGSLVNISPFDFSFWSGNFFIEPSFLMGDYSSLDDDRISYFSPQLEVLSTGEVIALGYHFNILIPNQMQLYEPMMWKGLFAFKYHPNYGIQNIEDIARMGDMSVQQFYSNLTLKGFKEKPYFIIDNDDNIIFATNWQDFLRNNTFKIGDSVLPLSSGSVVASLDTNYTINWVTMGTYTEVMDLDYFKESGSILLTSTSKDNFSMGQGTVNIMIGEDSLYQHNYTSFPALNGAPELNYSKTIGCLTKLDQSGFPTEMKKLIFSLPEDPMSNYFMKLKSATSPCGDFAFFVQDKFEFANDSIYVDGQVFNADSTHLFFVRQDCSQNLCEYLSLSDYSTSCTDSFEINFCEFFNLTQINYELYNPSGILVESGTAPVSQGQLSFQNNLVNAGEYMLVVTSPSLDTLEFTNYPLPIVTLDAFGQDTLCTYNGAVTLPNGSPNGGVYSGNGITGLQFDPVLAGNGQHEISYTFIDANGCSSSDMTSITVDLCAGLESAENQEIVIFPNPIQDKLTIDVAQNQFQLEIYDARSKLIFKQDVSGHIDLSTVNWSTGIYMVKIYLNDTIIQKRISKI